MQLQKIEPPTITRILLEGIARKIRQQFHPEKIILFGSRVWGTPNKWSDIDLLFIMEYTGYSSLVAAQISLVAKPRYVAMDILVRTPEEINDRLNQGDYFIKKILQEGKVLYEKQPSA